MYKAFHENFTRIFFIEKLFVYKMFNNAFCSFLHQMLSLINIKM